MAQKALRVALAMSGRVVALQILAEDMKMADLTHCWHEMVKEPAQAAGRKPPKLEVVLSPYRECYGPLLAFLRRSAAENPDQSSARSHLYCG